MALADFVERLRFKYRIMSGGEEPEYLFVPRHRLRAFAQALSDEVEGIGPPHHVFHFLATGERELEVFDLKVRVGGDANDIGVGCDA